MIGVGIILFITVLTVDVASDYRKWLRNRKVNHTREAWIRIAFLFPSIICFSWTLDLWQTVIPAFLVMFWYWLLFDSVYNILRGFNWLYTGSDDRDDAISDNFLQRLKRWQHAVVKIGGVMVSTVLYILIMKQG